MAGGGPMAGCVLAPAEDGAERHEVKAYVSNGAGWEPDIAQAGAPYASQNHFARCGMMSVFEWGSGAASFVQLP
jgi:hypothetical protein